MTRIPQCKWPLLALILTWLLCACQNSAKKTSLPQASKHVSALVDISKSDVAEVRAGMPQGSHLLESLFRNSTSVRDDLERVRSSLARARDHVQDLRVAKSTFFALVEPDGTILRSDRMPDAMAGKNLWAAVPKAARVVSGTTVEISGSLAEAAGVMGRNDAQWFLLVPIIVDEKVRGVYVTGWSWSAYAYRLETALRNDLKTVARREQAREPLIYVYVAVGGAVYGAPLSPEVNANAINREVSLTSVTRNQVWSKVIEITGREFALAVGRAPELGEDAAIAVLRSET